MGFAIRMNSTERDALADFSVVYMFGVSFVNFLLSSLVELSGFTSTLSPSKGEHCILPSRQILLQLPAQMIINTVLYFQLL